MIHCVEHPLYIETIARLLDGGLRDRGPTAGAAEEKKQEQPTQTNDKQ